MRGPLRHVKRGGIYLRSLGPASLWSGSPDDTSFSKACGGRWNPQGKFGALYLSGDADVALANGLEIVKSIIGPAATIDDLDNPETFFEVQEFVVKSGEYVDAVTDGARSALGFDSPDTKGAHYELCHAIGSKAYAEDESGIACVSAVQHEGEELVVFDSHASQLARMRGARRTFGVWRADQAVAARKKQSRKKGGKKMSATKKAGATTKGLAMKKTPRRRV